MKYCNKCGNELLDEAVICPKCGCASGNSLADEKQKENAKNRTISVIVALVGIAILVATVILVMGQI